MYFKAYLDNLHFKNSKLLQQQNVIDQVFILMIMICVILLLTETFKSISNKIKCAFTRHQLLNGKLLPEVT